jgi:hypothetical protein
MGKAGVVAKRILLAIALLAVLIAGAAASEVNPPLPTGKIILTDRVTVTVELARSQVEKSRGLSGRMDLKPGQGMLFVYDLPQPIGIWMKDMRFPLDIIWVREGKIVHIEKNAPPLSSGSPEKVYTATADLVLEVPAGFATKEKIRVGDSARMVLAQ